MKIASLSKELVYNEDRPQVQVLFETESTREIRILMRQGQHMKEHKAPFSIVVEIFDGEIDFGVQGTIHNLKKGDLITLKKNVPHDLSCTKDSIIRLSLSKLDTAQRVQNLT